MINIIAAIGETRELGNNNMLLWHIPEDLKRFKALTNGHAVIMGRKTYESIGKPLPNRLNIIVSRDTSYIVHNAVVTHSLQDAITYAKKKGGEEIFIIGGGQIYAEALPFADKLYLTVVQGTYQADTYFPDYSAFKNVISEDTHLSNGYSYTFLELQK